MTRRSPATVLRLDAEEEAVVVAALRVYAPHALDARRADHWRVCSRLITRLHGRPLRAPSQKSHRRGSGRREEAVSMTTADEQIPLGVHLRLRRHRPGAVGSRGLDN